MIKFREISDALQKGSDDIWYSADDTEVSYPSDGNARCFDIENNSFWFRHRNNCIKSLVRAFPPPSDGTIFDIGGGNGFVSKGLQDAGFDVALVEPGHSGIKNAQSRGVNHIICSTFEAARFKSESLPAIGLFDVIEHIEDDEAFIKDICKVLIRNGRVYATVPSHQLLWSHEDTIAGHFRRYRLKTFQQLFARNGFSVTFSDYIFRYLPIPIFLFRVLPFRFGLTSVTRDIASISKVHGIEKGIATHVSEALNHRELVKLQQKHQRTSLIPGASCIMVATKD